MTRLIFIVIFFSCLTPVVWAQNYAEEHYQYDRLHKMMKGYYNRGLYHKAVLYPDS